MSNPHKEQSERLAQRLRNTKSALRAAQDRLTTLEGTQDGQMAVEIERLRAENAEMRSLLFGFKASIERLPTG